MKDGRIKTAMKDEKGAALITVLCLVVLVGMISASVVTVSQMSNYTSRTFTDRSIDAYLAEGVAARVQWLIIADKRKFSNRLLGETDYEKEQQERFMADGILHKIDYYGTEVDVTILDLSSGFDISSGTPSTQLETQKSSYAEDKDMRDAFAAFLDCVSDYVDKDEFIRLKGMERSDYAAKGLSPLPRNANFQFREEIMLIPGFDKFYQPDQYGRLSSFRVIPPQNMQRVTQGNDFFSASKEQIMSRCGYSSEQADNIIQAREKWRNERIPLNQSLDVALLATLKNRFSFRESGYYTLLVEAAPEPDRAKRMLAASMQISVQVNAPGIRYYEWVLY